MVRADALLSRRRWRPLRLAGSAARADVAAAPRFSRCRRARGDAGPRVADRRRLLPAHAVPRQVSRWLVPLRLDVRTDLLPAAGTPRLVLRCPSRGVPASDG